MSVRKAQDGQDDRARVVIGYLCASVEKGLKHLRRMAVTSILCSGRRPS